MPVYAQMGAATVAIDQHSTPTASTTRPPYLDTWQQESGGTA